MRVRFIGNVTVKEVSYADGDEDCIPDAFAKGLIGRGAAAEVVQEAVQEPVKVEEETPIVPPFFKRNRRSKS